MSQISVSGAHGHENGHSHAAGQHGYGAPADLSPANTTVPAGWGKGAMGVLLLVGVACLGATAAYPFIAGGDADHKTSAIKHAFGSYHVGFIYTLSIMLGALVLLLVMRATQAGWITTLRRQIENIVGLMPVQILFVVPILFAGTYLFKWMKPSLLHSDPVLEEKHAYLDTTFFMIRLAIYFFVWIYLAMRMWGYSRRQDETGEKALTNAAQTTSTWGLLAFAITTAFASFDLVKSLDYHWFSTMFGVYFFAGSMLSGIAMTILICCALRGSGRLKGLVTEEHFHDMGKLLFSLNIFWTYVAFSQYFLYWYADIPEETAWIVVRQHNGWQNIFWVLVFGHFIAPLVILLFRGVKRSTFLLGLMAVWLLAMHLLDIFWLIRPITFMEHGRGVQEIPGMIGFAWVDITGIAGPLCVVIALLVWKVGRSPLIPMRDPRLGEATEHKNYV
ncbi:MAG: quinol:cytochrome C oxidoreductase [Phycisphaerales bacterium]